jgi:hypothetical protein
MGGIMGRVWKREGEGEWWWGQSSTAEYGHTRVKRIFSSVFRVGTFADMHGCVSAYL